MRAGASAIRKLFEEAVEIDGAQARALFLARACPDDAALRQRVEELLKAHASAGAFLPDRPGGSPLPFLDDTDSINAGLPIGDGLSRLEIGDWIGRYRLLEKIGEGGCGVVYRAEQTQPIHRQVALKVIKLGMDTKSVVARFEGERQALARMDHPNIAKILDAGATDSGRPYFILELVRGQRITRYCDERTLSIRARLELFVQVCQAVQHAHQKGIIHRDLKPSNVLVALNDGIPVPKIIDFGIAKAIEGRLTDATLFTAFEQFLGTPAYMSPEQAAMTSADIDTRTDIYSLGVLLYELLTGRTPFDTTELLAQGFDGLRRTILEHSPARPSTKLTESQRRQVRPGASRPEEHLRARIDPDLDWIVLRCLEKERARRYQTANGLALDIERHLRCEPVLARPPSRLYSFQKAGRRHKLAYAALSAAILALCTGTIVSSWEAARARHAEREQARLRRLEEAARRHAIAQEQIARQRAYAGDMNLAQQALDDNEFGRAQELLQYHRPQPGQEDLRQWEWRYLWQNVQSDALAELCRKSNAIASLAVSPNGQWLAIGEHGEGRLSVWDLPARRQVAHFDDGVYQSVGTFSPESSVLAFSSARWISPTQCQSTVRFWNPETRGFVGHELVTAHLSWALVYSADGHTLATFTSNDELTLWRMPEGTPISTFSTPFNQGLDPPLPACMTPDGRFAAHATPGGRVRVIELRTGRECWSAPAAQEFVWSIAVSSDGKTLASAEPLRLWDLASGKQLAQPEDERGASVGGIVFWPDGSKVANVYGSQSIRLWQSSDPSHLRQLGRSLHGHTAEIWTMALLPNQRTLVTGSKDGRVLLWDVSTNCTGTSRVTAPAALAAWRFTPDSQAVVALDQQGQVARWLRPNFTSPDNLFHIGKSILQANFSQDGKWLALAPTNGIIQIWDVARGAMDQTFAGTTQRSPLNSPGLVFTQQGDSLLVLDQQLFIRQWDRRTGRETRSWRAPVGAMTVALSPDQTRCLVLGRAGSRCPASLYNLTTGQEQTRDLIMANVEDAAFAPDGKIFAAASSFGGAKIWDATTLEEIAALPAYQDATFSACFSPNGKRLVIGGSSSLKLWDVDSRQEVLTLPAERTMFWPVAFSADGNLLGATNYKGELQIWQAPAAATDDQRSPPHQSLAARRALTGPFPFENAH